MENKFYYITESLQDEDSRLLLTNAAIQPDYLNGKCIGQKFECVGFAVRQIEMQDGTNCTNCILFDEDGNSYSTISNGVAKIVLTWIDCGINPTWEKPITVEYGQERRGQMQFYTLKAISKRRK